MRESGASLGFIEDFRARGAAIAAACTRCGACFRACPMVAPAGLAGASAESTAAGILDLLTGGEGSAEAALWAGVCSGSGDCIKACPEGINTRFMVQLARAFVRRKSGGAPLKERWRANFQAMSRSVRVLSRLQLPPEILARFKEQKPRARPPEIVFYTGCNVLRTPHIALLCLDILDLLGIDYEVMGGTGQCCGVYQFREGDLEANAQMAYRTIDALASAGAKQVLSWCPSCQVQIGEVSLPGYEARFGERPFALDPFLVYLAGKAEALAPFMVERVEKRIALHERPVFPAVQAAVRTLLAIVPGVELVEIDVPRVGTQSNSLSVLPAFKRELRARELAAVAKAGVSTLATVYHACHREICDAGGGKSFEVENIMEILGQGLGLKSEDLYKRWKVMGEIDAIVAETSSLAALYGLDLDELRAALAAEFAPVR